MKKTIQTALAAAAIIFTTGSLATMSVAPISTAQAAGTVSQSTSTITNDTGMVRVINITGDGIALWRGYGAHRQYAGRILPYGSRWRYSGTITEDGETWYNVGGDQWIEGTYVQPFPDKTDATYRIEAKRGVVIVPGSPALPVFVDHGTPRTDQSTWSGWQRWPIGSAWQYYHVAYSTDLTIATKYDVGGGVWVSGVIPLKENFAGAFTINVPGHPTWGTAVYDKNLKPVRILPAGSVWRTFGYRYFNGTEYLNLGGQQFVKRNVGTLRVLTN